MSVQLIIARRRIALISAFARTPFIQVQVESPAALPRLAFIESSGEANIDRLGRRSSKKVALVKEPGNPDLNSSVWVAAGYSDYKGAYLAFLRAAYSIDAKPADLLGNDVDHLLNRARSPQGSTFIRIEAAPSLANQAWGRLFESVASDPRFDANRFRERRTMSYVIAAKLAGRSPPRGPNDQAGINQLATFFASVGIDQTEALEGVKSMLDFAYKFR